VSKQPGQREIHGEQMLEIGFLCLNGPGREKSMGKIREKQLFF
jgi:hypothetical protein